MRKFWILIFSVLLLSFFSFQSLLFSEELSKRQCGLACHSNKKTLLHQMNFKSECTQCHNTSVNGQYDLGDHPITPFFQQARNILPASSKSSEIQHVPVLAIGIEKKLDKSKNSVLIPSGEFIMGSNDRWDDESPEFIAKTGVFLIDIYEVTNADYKIFVNDTHYDSPVFWNDNEIPEGLEEHPVSYVSWEDASVYCKWLGKRLPTEVEWEKAARGKLGYNFPWGNVFDPTKSNSPESKNKGAKPVGSYESGKSPYGLYDMAGNVWEWTSSWYLPHPGNKIVNPKYGKKNRIIKGGSWFDCLAYGCSISAPSYNRGAVVPSTRNNTIGFRCVKDIEIR